MNENISKIFETTGFTEMSEVQKQSIPAIAEGKNLFIQAKTGAMTSTCVSLDCGSTQATDGIR